MYKTIIEPFKIKSVEPIYMTTEAEREEDSNHELEEKEKHR